MIPTVIVLGLIVGRWRLLPIAALAWSALLLVDGIVNLAGVPGAAAVAFLNCAVGVLSHRVVWTTARRLTRAA